EVRRMAQALRRECGTEPVQIAIIGKNSAHWLMADLAVWSAGHVSVPVYPTLTPGSIRKIIEHSEAKVCFIGKLAKTDDIVRNLPAGVRLISLPEIRVESAATWDDLVGAHQPLDWEDIAIANERLATIFYTSGTTGEPKGVMHSF